MIIYYYLIRHIAYLVQLLFTYYYSYTEYIKRIVIHTIINISIQYEQFKLKYIINWCDEWINYIRTSWSQID